MAEHYRDRRNILAWQIDNEVEGNACCCPVCAEGFRRWLQGRYGTLDAMNAAHHNDVWSGEYSAWSQVRPPLLNHPLHQYNPGLVLDFKRWSSQSVEEYVAFQRDLIRAVIPGARITTNTWFCERLPNLYSLFRELDFVSYDNYPSTVPGRGSHNFHLDLMRGVKRQGFWIMEQLSGLPGCWMNMNRAPLPGMIKGYALQAMAHGADTVVHFRWRSAVGGAEMFWHGLIDHGNVPGRRFREFAELCASVKKLAAVDGTQIRSQVAVLMGMDSEYAFKSQLQAEGMYYLEQLSAWHSAFARLGVNVDVIDQAADLSGYRIVVAPNLYIRNEKTVAQLHRFASGGGTVLLTCRCGVKDEHNGCVMRPLPGDYADMAGARVVEYDPLGTDTAAVTLDGVRFGVTRWADILETDGAEVIGTYADQYYAGSAAITRNRFGAGAVYYVGTLGGGDMRAHLARRMLSEAALPFREGLPEGLEVVNRTDGERRFTFLFNNSPSTVDLPWNGRVLSLSPFGLRVPELSGEEI